MEAPPIFFSRSATAASVVSSPQSSSHESASESWPGLPVSFRGTFRVSPSVFGVCFAFPRPSPGCVHEPHRCCVTFDHQFPGCIAFPRQFLKCSSRFPIGFRGGGGRLTIGVRCVSRFPVAFRGWGGACGDVRVEESWVRCHVCQVFRAQTLPGLRYGSCLVSGTDPTGVLRSQETAFPWDPTAGLRLGPYGSPGGGARFLMNEIPL